MGLISVETVNTATGILGLLLTGATFGRVRAVRRAQRRERTLVRALYDTDAAAVQLRAAAEYLGRARDPRARELARDLTHVCGTIEGVTRALDAESHVDTPHPAAVPLHEQHYFTPDFLIDVVGRAQHHVDLLMYRPLLASTVPVLDALRSGAERGVEIRLLALSAGSSDEVLAHGAAFMPAAAVYRPEQLRPQLAEAERRITCHLADWPPKARRRFAMRAYRTPPGAHFIRGDSTVHHGFVGLLSGPMPTRFDERVHIEVPTTCRLGEQIMTHFELLWQSAESHGDRPAGPGGSAA